LFAFVIKTALEIYATVKVPQWYIVQECDANEVPQRFNAWTTKNYYLHIKLKNYGLFKRFLVADTHFFVYF
jgi:hypothetical protein